MTTLAETVRDFARGKIVERLVKQPIDLSVALQPDGYFVAIDRNNHDVGYGRTPLDAIVDLLDNAAEG